MKYYKIVVVIVKGMEKKYERDRGGDGDEDGERDFVIKGFFMHCAHCAHHLNGSYSCHIVIVASFLSATLNFRCQSHLLPFSLSPFFPSACLYGRKIYVYSSFFMMIVFMIDIAHTHTPIHHIIHKDKWNYIHNEHMYSVGYTVVDMKWLWWKKKYQTRRFLQNVFENSAREREISVVQFYCTKTKAISKNIFVFRWRCTLIV